MNMDYAQIFTAIIFILVLIAFIIGLVYCAKYMQKNSDALMAQLKAYVSADGFKEDVHKIMVHAEQLITGTKKGQERLLYVCGWINKHLPEFLQPVVTQEILVEIVNELFELYAEKTDNGTVVK